VAFSIAWNPRRFSFPNNDVRLIPIICFPSLLSDECPLSPQKKAYNAYCHLLYPIVAT
jgi:hypothetical protein